MEILPEEVFLCLRYIMGNGCLKFGTRVFVAGFLAETKGFEPPCRRKTGKLISSQPRYDHFDTSPYLNSIADLENLCKGIVIRRGRISCLSKKNRL